MGVLCLLYLVAALRTNICLCLVLINFVFAFGFLGASYFYAADGKASTAHTMTVGGGACAFAASMIAWYLWFTMILEAVDFPISLPVGDLSGMIKGKHEKELAAHRATMAV